MKKWRCTVCGEIVESETCPTQCPLCKAPGEKFVEVQEEAMSWAAEHVVGVAKGTDPRIIEGLHAEKAILKLPSTGRLPPLKKPSMPPSLPSCWAKF